MSIPQDETPQVEFMERLAELEQAQARIREELAALRAAHSIPPEQGTVPSQGVPLEKSEDLRDNTGSFRSDLPGTIAVEVARSDSSPGVVAANTLGPGVYGSSYSSEGVWGQSTSGTGVYGQSQSSYGIRGQSDSSTGVLAQSGSSIGMHAVGGGTTPGTPADNRTPAVFAEGGPNMGIIATSTSSTGVYGYSPSSRGIEGVSNSGIGVVGNSSSYYGVYGISSSGPGVHGESESGFAGEFVGKVRITGELIKAGGGFKIDHPLDPANSYLSHSFVESAEMKNLYDGVVVLDAKGEAKVVLSDWFEALNADFRYQLTPIGAAGPNLYIAEQISHGQFKIAGGSAGVAVCWQVTAIRKDGWAQAHPLVVEEKKAATERDHYLHPEVYGQTMEKSITWVHQPEVLRRLVEKQHKLPDEGERGGEHSSPER